MEFNVQPSQVTLIQHDGRLIALNLRTGERFIPSRIGTSTKSVYLPAPTEPRFSICLTAAALQMRGNAEMSPEEDADEISIGGLFHKRQNFLLSVSHLIPPNVPKAKRPHAHCLGNALFMRISPLSHKEPGARLHIRRAQIREKANEI